MTLHPLFLQVQTRTRSGFHLSTPVSLRGRPRGHRHKNRRTCLEEPLGRTSSVVNSTRYFCYTKPYHPYALPLFRKDRLVCHSFPDLRPRAAVAVSLLFVVVDSTRHLPLQSSPTFLRLSPGLPSLERDSHSLGTVREVCVLKQIRGVSGHFN